MERANEELMAIGKDALGEPDAARRVLVEEERRRIATGPAVCGGCRARATADFPRDRISVFVRLVEIRIAHRRAEIARIAHEREGGHGLERDAHATEAVDRRRASHGHFAR